MKYAVALLLAAVGACWLAWPGDLLAQEEPKPSIEDLIDMVEPGGAEPGPASSIAWPRK